MAYENGGYAPAYARLFAPHLSRQRTIVELGVFRGSGLALLAETFPGCVIAGLDIAPKRFVEHLPTLLKRGAFCFTEVPKVLEFDAFEPDTAQLEELLAGRKIDIFIDDGPHLLDPIASVAAAIRPLLAPGYLYVVEDNPAAIEVIRRVLEPVRDGVDRGLAWAQGSEPG